MADEDEASVVEWYHSQNAERYWRGVMRLERDSIERTRMLIALRGLGFWLGVCLHGMSTVEFNTNRKASKQQ